MPTSGNTLGERRYYRYETDGESAFKYLTDQTLGDAVGATASDALPDLPRRFQPRGVYVEAIVGGTKVRKFLITPTNDNSLYAAEASTTVVIDGITFATTGRRGEKMTYGRNPAGAAA